MEGSAVFPDSSVGYVKALIGTTQTFKKSKALDFLPDSCGLVEYMYVSSSVGDLQWSHRRRFLSVRGAFGLSS